MSVKTHIYCRTYAGDAQWLTWMLKSVYKFCKGFEYDITIDTAAGDDGIICDACLPNDDSSPFQTCVIIRNQKYQDDYIGQQIDKINADTQMHGVDDNDLIMMLDSDCFFTKEVTPETFLQDGKPIIWMKRYDSFEPGTMPWQPIVEKAVGFPVLMEHMRRHPFLYPKWFFKKFRDFMQRVHKIDVATYAAGQPFHAFSEFNTMGAVAQRYFSSSFAFIDVDKNPPPPSPIDQGWSHGGLKPERIEMMERILDQ